MPGVIDAHAHIGESVISDFETTEEELFSRMDDAGVQMAIVQPHPCPADPFAVLARIAELQRLRPERIRGLVSLNPHIGDDRYRKEGTGYIRDHAFFGIKIHRGGHGLSLASRAVRLALDMARELDLPAMIHTGTGAPFSLPSLVLPVAREYSHIRIILAHAGAGFYTAEALVVARECPNVYLETSWCQAREILQLVRELGPDRIMMGSDLPSSLPVEMAKYNSLPIAREEREWCLGGTARRVFCLENKAAEKPT